MAALPGTEGYQDRIAIKSDGITRFVNAGEIDWIEASGVTLHVGGKEFLHRHSLVSMLLRLDPRRFVRVHRSAVVNIESSRLYRMANSRRRRSTAGGFA